MEIPELRKLIGYILGGGYEHHAALNGGNSA